MAIVLKIGGVALEQQRHASGLWHALCSLHDREGVVLVHGGGKAVDALLGTLSMTTQRQEGIRITPPEQMDVIAGVLAGTLNKQLVGAINAARIGAGGRAIAVGLCVGDGGMLRTRKTTKYAFDPGRVGEVVWGEPGGEGGSGGELARVLLAGGFLPVVSSIGIDDQGGLLNLNADDAAAGLAKSLRASALVLLTDVAGVRDGSGRTVAELDVRGIDRMIASGEIGGGMIPKVRAALETARDIHAPVTIMSGAETSALEAWARGERVGTRIVPVV